MTAGWKEKIRRASDNLADREFINNKHEWATTKPSRNNITNSRHKLLDALARAFNGISDVCVAVYYDDEQEKLIIANNWRRSNYAEKYLNILKKLANGESREQVYEELFGLSILNRVYETAIGKFQEKTEIEERLEEEEKLVLAELGKFKNVAQEYNSAYVRSLKGKPLSSPSLSLNELSKKIEASSSDLFRRLKNLSEKSKNFYWECKHL